MYRFQRMLKDHSTENWSQLSMVTDARVLTCLMWSWVEHLREPVVSNVGLQQLCGMEFSRCEDFEDALKSLGKVVVFFQICLKKKNITICYYYILQYFIIKLKNYFLILL